MKSSLIQIRAEEIEKARWRERAEAVDRPLSSWVREACNRHWLSSGGPDVESALMRMRRLSNRLSASPSRDEVAIIANELRSIVESYR